VSIADLKRTPLGVGEKIMLSPETCDSSVQLMMWTNGTGLYLRDCEDTISWYFGTHDKEALFISLRKLSRAKRAIDALYEALEDEIRGLLKGTT